MSYDVFISYARADNDKEGVSRFVEALGLAHRVLTGRELKVFFDRSEIHTAQDWELRLLESLRASRSMIALLSPAYLQSEYCRLEWSRFELHSALRLVVDQGIRPLVVVPVGDLELELAKAGPEVRRLAGPVQRGLLPLTDLLDSLTDEYLLERIPLLKGDEGQGNPIEREIVDSLRWVQRLGERQAKSELSASHGFTSMSRRFVGRIAELRELRKALAECTEVAVSAEGVAGIGKSELANAYAHAFAWDYLAGRWFVPCEGQTDLPALLTNTMASDLNIQLTPEDRREADGGFYRVRAHLNALAPEARKVLVVLDNVDKDELVSTTSMQNLNVDADYFDILVTSRRRLRSGNRDEYLRTVTLGRLHDEELRDLLGVGLTADTEEIQAAQTLIQNTGGLTLAIEIAGVYLRDTGIRIVDYVESLQDGALALIDLTIKEPGVANAIAHPEKVIEQIFITAIKKLSPEQRSILAYAAQCHPDFIPIAWLEHLACAECPGLAERKLGKSAFERALKGLFGASLLEAPADGSGRCRLHRLIGETIRRMPDWDPLRADRFRDFISEVPELNWYDFDPRIQPLDIAAWVGLQSGDDQKLVRLMSMAGTLCHHRAFYREGEALTRRALEACERTLEPEHPNTQGSINNLAILLKDKGDLAGSEALMAKATEIAEKIYGKDGDPTRSLTELLAELRNQIGQRGNQ